MIVALCSTYREGPLAQNMIRSALRATPNVVVFEGPAGPPLEDDENVPETEAPDEFYADGRYIYESAWKTDAHKRTAMVEHCRKWRDEPPVWGIWLDGDEVLVNGEYLQDELNLLEWEDDPDQPFMGWPIKLVELDGGVTVCRGKVVRVDLIDSYSVSSSVFRNALGYTHGEGNVRLSTVEHWGKIRAEAARLGEPEASRALDQVRLPPPLPCEPFLVHRSALRHPARRGLRMHEQEAVELARAEAEGQLDAALGQKP